MGYIHLSTRTFFFPPTDSYPIMKGDCDSAQDVFPQRIHCSTVIKKLSWM